MVIGEALCSELDLLAQLNDPRVDRFESVRSVAMPRRLQKYAALHQVQRLRHHQRVVFR